MTMDSIAKFSAIYLTVAMLAGITLSLWPSSDTAARFESAPHFTLN